MRSNRDTGAPGGANARKTPGTLKVRSFPLGERLLRLGLTGSISLKNNASRCGNDACAQNQHHFQQDRTLPAGQCIK